MAVHITGLIRVVARLSSISVEFGGIGGFQSVANACDSIIPAAKPGLYTRAYRVFRESRICVSIDYRCIYPVGRIDYRRRSADRELRAESAVLKRFRFEIFGELSLNINSSSFRMAGLKAVFVCDTYA